MNENDISTRTEIDYSARRQQQALIAIILVALCTAAIAVVTLYLFG